MQRKRAERLLSTPCGRAAALSALAFFLVACESVAPGVACTDPRPMVCTMEYRPVCANLAEGGTKTYSSPCNACADVNVTSHNPEACEAE